MSAKSNLSELSNICFMQLVMYSLTLNIETYSLHSKHFMISEFWNKRIPSAWRYKTLRERQVLYYYKGVSPLVAGQTLAVNKYFLSKFSLKSSIILEPIPEPVPPAREWKSKIPLKMSAFSARRLIISIAWSLKVCYGWLKSLCSTKVLE